MLLDWQVAKVNFLCVSNIQKIIVLILEKIESVVYIFRDKEITKVSRIFSRGCLIYPRIRES